jgi:hypothetical protein
VVFQQDAAAAAQLVAQIRAEVLPELRTGGAGVHDLLRDARPRGLERAGVYVFLLSSRGVLVPDVIELLTWSNS